MKRSGITSVESKAAFKEKLVENFLKQNLPPKGSVQNKIPGRGYFSDNYKEIECRAVETPVVGTVEMFFVTKSQDLTRRISVPVTSRFIVCCSRDEKKDYTVAWSCSLS